MYSAISTWAKPRQGLSLCFGTMSFGGEADEATSAAMYGRCRDVGINFFDCANVYEGGRSEEILGKLIAGERDKVIITSKAYFPTGADVNARGAHRRHLMRAVEDSLRRLNTDTLTSTSSTASTLPRLSRRPSGRWTTCEPGKDPYPGASNFAAWQVARR